jgi:hypothetical protein
MVCSGMRMRVLYALAANVACGMWRGHSRSQKWRAATLYRQHDTPDVYRERGHMHLHEIQRPVLCGPAGRTLKAANCGDLVE